MLKAFPFACLLAAAAACPAAAQPIAGLPDPFLMASGRRVADAADWAQRRGELRELFLAGEHGRAPAAPGNIQATVTSSVSTLAGKASDKRIRLAMGPGGKLSVRMRLLVPAGKGPFPVLLKNDGDLGLMPIPDEAVARGYIVAEFVRTDVAPDDSGRGAGVFPLYPGYDWGVLAAWAWGFSRVVDYLLTRDDVDPAHIAITGHSRGGKTTLLAGALDERIALTAPAGSGTGGCAIFRDPGHGSETLASITGRFGYWFIPGLKAFAARETYLPFDQHELEALVAPRALLCEDGSGDPVGNPRGAQRSYWAAREAYRFLGVPGRIGIYQRPGGHEQNAEDWRALMDFADLQFFGKPTKRNFDSTYYADLDKGFAWTAPKTVGLARGGLRPDAGSAGTGAPPRAGVRMSGSGRDGLGRIGKGAATTWRRPMR